MCSVMCVYVCVCVCMCAHRARQYVDIIQYFIDIRQGNNLSKSVWISTNNLLSCSYITNPCFVSRCMLAIISRYHENHLSI